jgi:hypothetical protein
MKMTVVWDVAGCSLVLHYTGVLIALMKAASTSETFTKFDQTTRRNIPEDSHIAAMLT